MRRTSVLPFVVLVVVLIAALAALPGCRRDPDPHTGHDAPAAPADDAARAAAVKTNPPTPPGDAPPGMVWVPGGTFWMGCEGCGMPDALPSNLVSVDGFWMDRTPVTNAEFERFVAATKYVTVAERPIDPADFPGVPR